ncbi:MAG: ribosome assembly cofactor RimP [Treponema sp.]|jgi:ribosome maturation factor RimP|nr:ribosome assembly cofactor RimP [Treponema sp.]
MRYTPRTGTADSVSKDPGDLLFDSLEPVVKGLGMSFIELAVSRHKGSVQVRAVVYRPGAVGVEDVALAHRAVMPRLELAFPGQDIYLEVSSPGIDRQIKDGSEFIHYVGRGIRCYRTDISDWTGGILGSADEKGIILKTPDGELRLVWDIIAKAKLSHSEEAGG